MADDWDESGSEGGEQQGSGWLLDLTKDPLAFLRRRWLLMVAVAVFGLLATAVVVATRKPLFVAKATVLVASQRVPEDFVRPTIEEDPLERMNALLGRVMSRANLLALIEKHDLYPKLRKEWPPDAVVGYMRGDILVAPESGDMGNGRDERAQLIGISYQNEDAQKAADVANDLAGVFIEAGLAMRSEQASLTTEFMKKEMVSAEQALSDQGKKIAAFQAQHQGELPGELQSHLARLERLQQQRQSLAMQIAETETRIAEARASLPVDSPQTRLDALQGKLAQELAVNTEDHPNVKALRYQIELLKKQTQGQGNGSMTQLAGAVGREVQQLRDQLADTDKQIQDLDAKVAAIPTVGETYAALERRNQVLQETYLEYLRKVKEAELAESLERAQQGARVSILDHAYPPDAPTGKRVKLALMGVVGSFGMALAAALALEWRDPVIVSAGGLEGAGGVQVLGSVPRIA